MLLRPGRVVATRLGLLRLGCCCSSRNHGRTVADHQSCERRVWQACQTTGCKAQMQQQKKCNNPACYVSAARMTTTLYAKLGLAPDCTAASIKSAFHRLAKLHHPDKHASSGDTQRTAASTSSFQEVCAAYEVLRDVERRREYDRRIVVANSGYFCRSGRRFSTSASSATPQQQQTSTGGTGMTPSPANRSSPGRRQRTRCSQRPATCIPTRRTSHVTAERQRRSAQQNRSRGAGQQLSSLTNRSPAHTHLSLIHI